MNPTPVPSNALPKPSNAPFLVKNDMMSNSSLAALSFPSGEQHLYHQERSGQIKQGLYSSTMGEWLSTSISVVALDARNNTPLATVKLNGTTPRMISICLICSSRRANFFLDFLVLCFHKR